MADIGNGHHQAVAAAAERLAVHRVIEVARGLAVNGDERQMTDVLAPVHVLFQHLVRQFLRLLFHLGREHIGQVVLAQGNLDFHAGIGKAAENLAHAADGFVVRAGLSDDFHRHHLAGLGLACVFHRHQDVLVDAPVFCDQKADAAFEIVAADDELC